MEEFADMISQFYAMGFYTQCQQKAWTGLANPEVTYDVYRDAYLEAGKDYFKALTDVYNKRNN